jgi:hypothetical protein
MTKFYPIIKRFKRNTTLLLTAFLTTVSCGLFAQTQAQVNINVSISSPYSPFYADYAGQNASKVLLIVQNLTSTQKKIKLTGQLSGDNGITISTKSTYVPLQPIILNPNETKQLNGLALKDIFDLNTLNVYGVDKVKLVQTSRLPEGNYTFCIQAVDMNTNQVISTGAPLGCSSISIIYPDAPFLMNPLSNTTIAPIAEAMSFSWGSNVVLPMGIEYTLQVVQMPDERKDDPNRVLDASSGLGLIINRKVFNRTSIGLIELALPNAFKFGKRYAWRVIAADPSGKIIFKNKGISTANEFRYGEKPNVASLITLKTPEVDEGIEKLDELFFKWSFTDNSSQNDNIGFYNGGLSNTGNSSNNKYELYLNKLKTGEQKLTEQKARDEKLSSLKKTLQQTSPNSPAKMASLYNEIQNLQQTPLTIYADKGIVVSVDKDNIDFKSSPAMVAYLKDGSDYQWSVKHVVTGTLSQSRTFMLRGIDRADYKLSLVGNLRYNFRNQYLAGASKRDQIKKEVVPVGQSSKITLTEEEKGFSLANKSISVLKVNLLAPIYKVTKSIKIKENGLDVIKSETTDSIAPLSDLLATYNEKTISQVEYVVNSKTDDNGNFNIDVPIKNGQYKVIDPNVTVNGKNYALVQGLVIRVNDTRFSDPNWFVTPYEAGTTVNLKESTVECYSYKMSPELFVSDIEQAPTGKLYVLRNGANQIKGEVENRTPEKKDIPIYKTNYVDGKITPSGTTSYTVVGLRNIVKPDYTINKVNKGANIAGGPFLNMVSHDEYTFFFEPDNNNNAITYTTSKRSNDIGKKELYENTTWRNRDITDVKVNFKPQFISTHISGRYVYNWAPDGKSNPTLPLPEGTELKLVRGDLVTEGFGKLSSKLNNQVAIATTTVKKNGEYTFDIGLVDYNDFDDGKTPDLVILITNDYYYAKPYPFKYSAGKTINVPELTAAVKQFSVAGKVGSRENRNGVVTSITLGSQQMYLCREIDAEVGVGRPQNEGDPEHKAYFKKIYELKNKEGALIGRYEIIDRTLSDNVGVFTFNRLILSKAGTYDNYHIFSEPMSNSPGNYQSIEDFTVSSLSNDETAKIFTDNQVIPKKNVGLVYAEPMAPYIDGAVYPNSNTSISVLTKVLVEMFDMPITVKNNLTDEQYASLVAFKTPKTYITGENGRFIFENIRAEGDKIKNAFGTVIEIAGVQPWKLLRFTKQGFLPTYYVANSGKPFAKGQRDPGAAKVFMKLPRNIIVTVKNSNNQNIPARIIVGDDFSWMDYSPGAGSEKNTAKTPKGNVKFTIMPVDKANYKTATVTRTISEGTKNLNYTDSTKNVDFKVDNIEHTILVRCYLKGTNTLLKANVAVLNAPKFTQVIENNFQGEGITTVVTIPAGSTQFDLKVVPENVNYTIAKTQVQSNGIGYARIDVEVEPAATLTIKATEEYMQYVPGGGILKGHFEKAKQKASNYSFYIDDVAEDEYEIVNPYGSGPLALVTLLASDTRVIRRLPLSMYVNVKATKEGFLGDSEKIISFASKQLSATLDLKISELDASAMHGFPIELVAAIKQNNGQYLISGRLNPNVGNNGNLKAKSTTGKLEFNKVLVDVFKISGRGTVITPVKPLIFEQNSIDATLFDKYNVKITSKNGLELRTIKDKGSIVGKVAIDPSSLAKGITVYSSMDISKNYLYLSDAARPAQTVYSDLKDYQESNDLETFSTAKTDMAAIRYWVSTVSGSLPVFTGPDGFLITPDKSVEMVASGIRFNGTIQTNLANVADTSKIINAKALFTISNDNINGYPLENFKIKLKDWYLNVTGWGYGSTGFNADGYLNALGLTIPFTDLNIFKDKIGFGKFDVKTLKLLNIFPVTFNAGKVSGSFGFDKGFSGIGGAWSVSVLSTTGESSIASINGLPDLKQTDQIKIKNISLYDTGDENDTRILLDEQQAPVTLNGIANFRPGSISGSSTEVKFRGDLNMDIPGFTGLEAVTYDLKYQIDAANNLIHVDDKPFQNLGLDTKGILVKFNGAQSFKNGVLELNGTLRDKDPLAKDKYEIPVKLIKTLENNIASTKLFTTENEVYLNKSDKSIYLAKRDNLTIGNSTVINNEWEYFKLKGLLTQKTTGVETEDGIKPSPIEFDIKGELVANSSELGIKNMGAGPMTGFSIVYDFNENALIGSGHLSQDLSFAHLDLDAELKIGNPTDWYIMASGKASINNMPIFKDIGVAFMVGNAKISSTQQAAFYKHFGGNIKPSPNTYSAFQGQLKGILFMGSLEMKLPLVPTIDIDLSPIAKVQFDNGLYAATYFRLDFANKPKITVGGRVGAYVKLSAGASVGLACAGVSLGAEANAEINGSLDTDFNFAAMLALNFQLQGSAYVGVGLCTSSCSTVKVFGISSPIKCYRKQYGKVLTIGVQAKLSNDGLSLTGSGQTKTEN